MSTTEDPQAARIQAVPAAEPAAIPLPAPSPAPPDLAIAERRRLLLGLDRVLVVLVLGLAFLLASFAVRNPDFYRDIALGRLLVQGQYRFGSDPFTWGSEPNSWVNALTGEKVVWVNHSWLFAVLVYGLFLIPPIPYVAASAVVVFKALLVTALAALMIRVGQRGGQRWFVPALCTALALLVLSPRLFLQPVIVSYLFLGVTLWLLEMPRRKDEGRRMKDESKSDAASGSSFIPHPSSFWSWWLLPLLFLLWVNLDQWFFLGPVVVVLYLLGEALQRSFGQVLTGADKPAPGSLATLSYVLLVGLAACLVNPFHLHAFTLPAQLGFSVPPAVRADSQFQVTFLSPVIFKGLYFHPYVGLSVAGLSYFPLLLLSLVSFFLARHDFRWWRLLLWLAFALLGAYHARAIPFFAVVAGPITALNLLDFMARRQGDKVTVATGGSPVARTATGEPPVATVSLSPWVVGGRVLALVIVGILLVAAWPGWLQARPYVQHRVSFGIEASPSADRLARQIAAWRKQGLLDENAVWFNTNPEISNYLSWYAPGERTFLDQRLNLYPGASADYVGVRRSLGLPDNHPNWPGPIWRQVFRERGVRYLLFYENDPVRTNLLQHLLANRAEFAPLYLDGQSAVFGWTDPDKPGVEPRDRPYEGLRLDLNRLAFGPQATPAPSRPGRAPKVREWYTELWDPPAPLPLDAYRAQMFFMEYQLAQKRSLGDYEAMLAASLSGMGAQGDYPFSARRCCLMLRYLQREWVSRDYRAFFALGDNEPPSGLYEALRAVRRALVDKPDDAPLHLLLGQIALHLNNYTRERSVATSLKQLHLIRLAQATAALQQAIRLDPDLEQAHGMLVDVYDQQGFHDLAHHHRREQVRCLRLYGRSLGDKEEFHRRLEALDRDLKRRESELKVLQDRFELAAAGKSLLEKAALALGEQDPKPWLDPRAPEGQRFGLAEKALALLEQIKPEDLIVIQGGIRRAPGAIAQLDLLFLMGRIAEVRDRIGPEMKLLLGKHPDLDVPAYEMYRLRLAAVEGDYQQADEAAHEMLTAMCGPAALRDVSVQVALLIGQILQQEAAQAGHVSPLMGPLFLPSSQARLNLATQLAHELPAREADLRTLRAWIALEGGKLAEAEEQLRITLAKSWPPDRALPWLTALAAQTPLQSTVLSAAAQRVQRGPNFRFAAQPLAILGMQWMQRQ